MHLKQRNVMYICFLLSSRLLLKEQNIIYFLVHDHKIALVPKLLCRHHKNVSRGFHTHKFKNKLKYDRKNMYKIPTKVSYLKNKDVKYLTDLVLNTHKEQPLYQTLIVSGIRNIKIGTFVIYKYN